MSYEVLARKWRPQSFDDVVAQPHILKPLLYQLDSGHLHSAILFTGTRGVGKTTLARLFAKALNCETNGVSAQPCNQCSACTDIQAARFPDMIEVDAASRTRVEDTLELLENANYMPSRGRYKIYLIDEVHMLSNSSFNALLKSLEEPPPHVKYILATTDPQKLPVTVLSRCLQFSLRTIPQPDISGRMAELLQKEHIDYNEQALDRIAHAARGSMRDALTLLDQAVAFGQGAVVLDSVNEMLGTVSQTLLADMFEALIARDADQLFEHLHLAESRSLDYNAVLADMLEVIQAMAIYQFDRAPLAPTLIRLGKQCVEALRSVSAEDLQVWYQIVLQGRKDLPYAVSPYSGFEMTWIRLLAFKPLLVEREPIDWETAQGGIARSTGESTKTSTTSEKTSHPSDAADNTQSDSSEDDRSEDHQKDSAISDATSSHSGQEDQHAREAMHTDSSSRHDDHQDNDPISTPTGEFSQSGQRNQPSQDAKSHDDSADTKSHDTAESALIFNDEEDFPLPQQLILNKNNEPHQSRMAYNDEADTDETDQSFDASHATHSTASMTSKTMHKAHDEYEGSAADHSEVDFEPPNARENNLTAAPATSQSIDNQVMEKMSAQDDIHDHAANETDSTGHSVDHDAMEPLKFADHSDQSDDEMSARLTMESASQSTSQSQPTMAASQAPTDAPTVELGDTSSLPLNAENWSAICMGLPLPGYAKNLASNCAFDQYDDRTKSLNLCLSESMDTLHTDMAETAILNAIRMLYGSDLQLNIRIRADADRAVHQRTPDEQRAAARERERATALETLRDDPNIKQIQDHFGVELSPQQMRVNHQSE